MAAYTAIASGLWTAGSTWSATPGATAYPVDGDTADANGFTIQITNSQTITSITNTTAGTFILNDDATLTCSGANGITQSSNSTPTLQYTGITSATFNGSFTFTVIAPSVGIRNSGSGTLNLYGNYATNVAGSSGSRRCIDHTGTGKTKIIGINNGTTYTGNVLFNAGAGTSITNPCLGMNAGIVEVSGNIAGMTQLASLDTGTVYQEGGEFRLVHGGGSLPASSITAGSGSSALFIKGGTGATLIGDIKGSNTNNVYAVATLSTLVGVTINVTGTVTSGNNTPGIYIDVSGIASNFVSTGLVKVGAGSILNNVNGILAIQAPRITIESGVTWFYQQFNSPTGTYAWTAGTTIVAYPPVTDVRAGTYYDNIMSNVVITSTAGTFTCSARNLAVNQLVTITGSFGTNGSITGYTSGSSYYVKTITGTSPNVTGFVLSSSLGGTAITTTVSSGAVSAVFTANNKLGTCAVPGAGDVLQGVPVDATTGTLIMTPANFWNALTTATPQVGSIGERLKNVSTPTTLGQQIASYNI